AIDFLSQNGSKANNITNLKRINMKYYGLKYGEYDEHTGKSIDERPLFQFAISPEVANCGIDFLPHRTHDTDTGWDVKCADLKVVLRAGLYAKIDLGFRVFSPPGYWLELRPRSS